MKRGHEVIVVDEDIKKQNTNVVLQIAQGASFAHDQFDKQDYSDCQIFFKSSGRSLHLHKLVLCTQSEFFKTCFRIGMQESQQSKIEIEKDEDEELVTSLLRSLYTNKLVIKRTRDIVPLLQLAEKYMLQCASKVAEHLSKNITMENVLACLSLELNKYALVKQKFTRLVSIHANNILEQNSFVALDEVLMSNLLASLVNVSNESMGFAALRTWINHDKENRAGFAFEMQEIIQDAAKSPPLQFASFDPKNTHNAQKVEFSHDNSRVTFTENQFSAVLGQKCTSYKIRLLSDCQELWVGMSASPVRGHNSTLQDSYHVKIMTGSVKGPGSCVNIPILPIARTVVEVSQVGEDIYYSLNSRRHHVFVNVRKEVQLYPSFYTDQTCSIEFI